MAPLGNQRGYALFLTLLMIILFSILAVSLATLVQSASSRSTIRETDSQALELSEKGLQHIVQQIHYEIKAALGQDGLSRSDFQESLERILDRYHCDFDGSLRADQLETGAYEVCIESYRNVTNDSGAENELRKYVTFKSVGQSKELHKENKYYMEIGADTVPDALKYAVSTIKPSGRKQASDGNVYLHGGLEIYGDIKVDNHLFTHDHGPGLSGNDSLWRRTTLPLLQGAKGKHAKIVLGGNLYRFQSGSDDFRQQFNGNNRTEVASLSFYKDHLAWTHPMNKYRRARIGEMFVNQENLPVIVNRDWDGSQVSILDKIQEANQGIVPRRNMTGNRWFGVSEYRNIQSSDSLRFIGDTIKRFLGRQAFPTAKITEHSTVQFREGDYRFDQWYIRGNVEIGNMKTEDENRYYDNVVMGGYTEGRGAQLFVDGNVKIRGANLKSNLTIYTTGQVDVRYSTIEGKEFAPHREGSLIVFAKDKVFLANNSLYKDAPSQLKGFFYSEEDLEMFGVGSHIKIHGGLAAKRITLNAVRGLYYGGNTWSRIRNPGLVSSPSRLSIYYDTELIENYLQLNPPEPIIREVDPAQLLDRKRN